uniref:Uncharacterized protein n=1 Tax=Physcomitrium patens TaxID=3218 RepID=A0A2K1K6L0_PHYPA|nr:hypothetical protein PHYPA_011312 [Physcomitrium patens]PNR49424.1 hypothetical protein PHYPA_011320 [Physcomitrium patens]
MSSKWFSKSVLFLINLSSYSRFGTSSLIWASIDAIFCKYATAQNYRKITLRYYCFSQ